MRPSSLMLLAALGLTLPAGAHRASVEPTVWSGERVGGLASLNPSGLSPLRDADVIYVGETHDDAAHHAYEAKLIKILVEARLPFVVGWEMFDRSQQRWLDEWDHHRLSPRELFRRTNFERTWAVYSPWYRRLLQETRRYGIANLGLNAPTALVHKVAQGERLSPDEQAQLPRGFKVVNGAFKNFVSMMNAHPGAATANLRRFFAAQSLWEQTMATSIVNFRVEHPSTKILVLTGRGHLQGGFGIPSFVAQKTGGRQLVLFPGGNALGAGR